jgi:hypothetical protein
MTCASLDSDSSSDEFAPLAVAAGCQTPMNIAIEAAAVSDTEVLSREKEEREKHIDD